MSDNLPAKLPVRQPAWRRRLWGLLELGWNCSWVVVGMDLRRAITGDDAGLLYEGGLRTDRDHAQLFLCWKPNL
jgi:hypothetical protein